MRAEKKYLFVLAVAVVCILIAVLNIYFSAPFREAPSAHTGPALEGASVWTEQQQYPRDTGCITVCASNEGGTWTESHHPVLEIQHDGIWYTLKDLDKDSPRPSNALTVLPWETKQFECYVGCYGTPLRPGHYRLVFAMLYDDSYVAAEFDIV